MNREVIFRGKKANDGEWVFGDLVQDKDQDKCFIHYFEYCNNNGTLERTELFEEVLKNTVGQFSGISESRNLKGKYIKNKIYDGDLIYSDGWEEENLSIVNFEDGKFISYNKSKFENENLEDKLWPIIAGNIYDNSELLNN